jgi:uncharacterized membrane protein
VSRRGLVVKTYLLKIFPEGVKVIFKDTLELISLLIFGAAIFFLINILPLSDFVKKNANKAKDWYIVIVFILILFSAIIRFVISKIMEISKETQLMKRT